MAFFDSPYSSSSYNDPMEEPVMVGAGASKGIIPARPAARKDRCGIKQPLYAQVAIRLKAEPPANFVTQRSITSSAETTILGPNGEQTIGTAFPFGGKESIKVAEKDLVIIPRTYSVAGQKDKMLGFSSWSGENYGKYMSGPLPNFGRLMEDYSMGGIAATEYDFDNISQNLAGFTVQTTGTTSTLNTGRKEILAGQHVVWRIPHPSELPQVTGQPGRPRSKVYSVLEPLSSTTVQEQLYLAYDTMMDESSDGVGNLGFCSLLPNQADRDLLSPHQEWALSKMYGVLNSVIRGVEALAIRGVVDINTPKKLAQDEFNKVSGQFVENLISEDPDFLRRPENAAIARAYATLQSTPETNVAGNQGVFYNKTTQQGTTIRDPKEEMPFVYFKSEMDEMPERRDLEATKTAESVLWLASRLGTINEKRHLNQMWKKNVLDSVLIQFVGSHQLQEQHFTYGQLDLMKKRRLNPRETLLAEHRTVSAYAPSVEMNGQNTGINSVKRRIVGTALNTSGPATQLNLMIGFNNREYM